jgi:hypothetical protein
MEESATPLTSLTKKDAFSWTLEATKDFEELKEVMCKALVLMLRKKLQYSIEKPQEKYSTP